MKETNETATANQTGDWSFHGLRCDKAQYDAWKERLTAGHCPFCRFSGSNQRNNLNRHIRACIAKGIK